MAINNKKGFSLPELLAVMAIMAILAAVSTPFIRDYMKDAANDRAKVAMQIIAQGYKNYKTDFPTVSMSGAIAAPGSCDNVCTKANIKSGNINILSCCNYVKNVAFATFSSKYTFKVNSTCGSSPSGSLACMTGIGSGKYGATYHAWVDQYGAAHDSLE